MSNLSSLHSRMCRWFVALLRNRVASRAVMVAVGCGTLFFVSGCTTFHTADSNVVRTKVRRNRPQAKKLTAEASEHIEQHEYDLAAELLTKALAADRTYAKAHNNMGLVYFAKNDLFRAALSFQEAMRFHPQCPAPLNNLGLTFESALRLDSAISYYQSAHELLPNDAEYLGNLIRARLRAGEPVQTLRPMLQKLYFIERRPEWVEWTREQLQLTTNPNLDRGPDSPDLTDLNGENDDEPFDESSRILYDSGPPAVTPSSFDDDVPPAPQPAATVPMLPADGFQPPR